MKRLFTLLYFFTSVLGFSQIVNIPDVNFKAELISDGVDTNGDNEIQISEAENILYLNISSEDVVDLAGIEAFTNISKLECNSRDLAVVDLSNNTLLRYLTLSRTGVTALDLSKNTELFELRISQCALSELDLSSNVKLKKVYCRENEQLTTVDLSECVELQTADFSKNNLSNITFPATNTLEIIACDYNKLSELDVSMCPALNWLNCSENQLGFLDVSKNTALNEFYCYSNSITELDVSKNSLLTKINFYNNELTTLDFSNNPELTNIVVSNNPLTDINLSNNAKLEHLTVSQSLLETLDLSANPSLTSLRAQDSHLKSINLSKNPLLKELLLDENSLTEIDLSNNPLLDRVYLDQNPLTAIDFSHNPNITNLNVSETALTELDLKGNLELEVLQCQNNPALDVVFTQHNINYIKKDAHTFVCVNCTVTDTTLSICNSYLAPDGKVYDQNGTYSFPNPEVDTNYIVLQLTVNQGTESQITETACEEYTAPDGIVYTKSGTYTAVIENAIGCDSTITIDLTIDPMANGCEKVTSLSSELNTQKTLTRTYDVLGNEVPKETKGQLLIRKYSDGTREKVFVLE